MYWIETSFTDNIEIKRASMDGSGQIGLHNYTSSYYYYIYYPPVLAIDYDNQLLFWTDSYGYSGEINILSTDGSYNQTLDGFYYYTNSLEVFNQVLISINYYGRIQTYRITYENNAVNIMINHLSSWYFDICGIYSFRRSHKIKAFSALRQPLCKFMHGCHLHVL